jgi:hypothetical protein
MKNKKRLILWILLVLLIVACAVVVAYLYKQKLSGSGDGILNTAEVNTTPIVVEQKKVQIYQGNDRPIAVMIDNHKDALPQAGLGKAYMVYEIIVEGGESRLMALFKGADLAKIGPVRSSRHYFLDYALENDAIYVHFGWSPEAQSDISTLGVNNLNGLYESAGFWRVKDKKSPHNAVASTEKILAMANSKGYRTTSDATSVLNYTVDTVNLTDGIAANNITLPYSQSNSVKWTYDADTLRYQRYSKGIKQTDWDTGEAVTAKNIIVEFIENTTLNDGENKGRQTMDKTGTKDGYYITNGKAIKIKCTKSSRSSKTVYKDLSGNEIKVNDGNTFVQICPINANVTIE